MSIPINNELSDLITLTTLQSDIKVVKKAVKRRGPNSLSEEDAMYYARLREALKIVIDYYTP